MPMLALLPEAPLLLEAALLPEDVLLPAATVVATLLLPLLRSKVRTWETCCGSPTERSTRSTSALPLWRCWL